MFEQDYIMRMIHQVIWAMLKMLFDIDTEAPVETWARDEEEKALLFELFAMVDSGQIGKAEDIVFELADVADRKDLKLILLFFSYLNDKSDEFLREDGFCREELQEDLRTVLAKYGVDAMAQMLQP